jgi:hypothetical protein
MCERNSSVDGPTSAVFGGNESKQEDLNEENPYDGV